MSGEREGKVVCVTGASGYIASWLVKLLLQFGYTVKATVRDPNDPKTSHLRALDVAKERLHLFKANLLEEGSFDSAVHGCQGVFHTASPVNFSPNDPQVEVIDPAVKGTLNVLRSCAKVHSIKRIIITSSTASVFFTGTPPAPDVIIDETWFSKPDVCEELKMWYPLSKTLAEDAARRFAEENRIDLVTIHPGFVFGPFLQPNINFSVELILNLINVYEIFGKWLSFPSAGVETFPNPGVVDVRDVAYAHIRALELPTASDRYILVERVTSSNEILKILRELYPTLHLRKKFEDNKHQPTFQFSKERAKSLGIDFIPCEVSLRDTMESFKEKGFLSF